jgi:hypothetical protein
MLGTPDECVRGYMIRGDHYLIVTSLSTSSE